MHDPDEATRRRRTPTWLHLLAAIVATALLTGMTTAWAGHRFGDVPDTNPFHDDIDWLAETGLSSGFADGTFRPTEPITRQTMAAVLRRSFDQQAGLTATSTSSTVINATKAQGWTTLAGHSGTSVRVPPGTTARVVTTVAVSHFCESGKAGGLFIAGAPYCQLRVRIDGADAAPGAVTISYSDLTDAQLGGDPDLLLQPAAASFTFVSPVLGPGQHTIIAQVRATSDATGSPEPSVGVTSSTIVSEVALLDAS